MICRRARVLISVIYEHLNTTEANMKYEELPQYVQNMRQYIANLPH